MTAMGKRGEAYPPRGKRACQGGLSPFCGAAQVRKNEADEAEAVRAAVSLPVLSPASLRARGGPDRIFSVERKG